MYHKAKAKAASAKAPSIDIEALLKEADEIASKDIKDALEQAAAAERKQKQDRLISQIRKVRQTTLNAVEHLRNIRKEEQKAKAYLTAIAAAEKNFLCTADASAYDVELREAMKLI
jgi:hypothetical protein